MKIFSLKRLEAIWRQASPLLYRHMVNFNVVVSQPFVLFDKVVCLAFPSSFSKRG